MNPSPNPFDDSDSLSKTNPDLLAWARQTFDEKEFLDGLRDIEIHGGKTFESLILEVEEIVNSKST
jgi:hypothetical protein